MPIEKSAKQCSGCSACATICPQKCIKMIPDAMGFKYPKVDQSACTNCNACEKICPLNKETISQKSVQKIYAARCKDFNEVLRSQSGGAFVALSNYILSEKGVVYGATFQNNFLEIKHVAATTYDGRDSMRGSKYIQSDIEGVFDSIIDNLKQGLKVMFSGTPCQVAAVNAVVPNSLKNNLFTVDLICSGVAAPQVWADTIKWLQEKEQATLIAVNLRDKHHGGWRNGRETYLFSNNGKPNTYKFRFATNTMKFRPSCSACPFSSMHRTGDISIGDLWGIEKIKPLAQKFDDDNGCSLVLLNTPKGQNWFDTISNELLFEETEEKLILQPPLKAPMKEHPRRAAYAADFEKHGLKYAMYRHGELGPLRIAKIIKNALTK